MINFFAKSLVLIHTILSIAAMAWAAAVFLQFKDYGWIEPYKEVLEYTKEGAEKASVRHASVYDKSLAALTEAAKIRDTFYPNVKPALEAYHFTEPFLADNHLYYSAELKRLRDGPGPIEVKRLQNLGKAIEPNTRDLGKPLMEANAIKGVTKPIKAYEVDFKDENDKIDAMEIAIRKIVNETKKYTALLTGTDETNKYVQPGLYDLVDLEYKAQQQIKVEINDIKPAWSKAIEDAKLYRYRRLDLEADRDRLKAIAPKK